MNHTAWTLKKLHELGFVGRGRSRHRPRNDPSLYGGEYPFIQTGNVKAAELYLSEWSATYNEQGLAQSKLWEPGTLLITIAANIADTAILKVKACFPDSIVGFVPYREVANVYFVKYHLDTIKLQMQNISRGTTQDNLSLDKLLTFDISTPPIAEQERIASVLKAYDDLIENNTRRIQVLEHLAQLISQEWFVNFRFPGHEDVEMVESELGLIPEGWAISSLDEACAQVVSGGTPARKDPDFWTPSEVKWFKTKELQDDFLFDSEEHISQSGLRGSSAKLLPAGAVVMAIYAAPTVGRLGILTEPASFNQAACGLVPEEPKTNTFFVFHKLYELREYFNNLAQGAAQQNISVVKVRKSRFALPDVTVMVAFKDAVEPIHNLVRTLAAKNRNLRQTRDLLLPKLISGEIDVSGLEPQAVAAAEV